MKDLVERYLKCSWCHSDDCWEVLDWTTIKNSDRTTLVEEKLICRNKAADSEGNSMECGCTMDNEYTIEPS